MTSLLESISPFATGSLILYFIGTVLIFGYKICASYFVKHNFDVKRKHLEYVDIDIAHIEKNIDEISDFASDLFANGTNSMSAEEYKCFEYKVQGQFYGMRELIDVISHKTPKLKTELILVLSEMQGSWKLDRFDKKQNILQFIFTCEHFKFQLRTLRYNEPLHFKRRLTISYYWTKDKMAFLMVYVKNLI